MAGPCGRLVGPGQVQAADGAGRFEVPVGMTPIPTAMGFQAALPGDTWSIQAWYRDANPTPGSNFTGSVRVDFL